MLNSFFISIHFVDQRENGSRWQGAQGKSKQNGVQILQGKGQGSSQKTHMEEKKIL